MSISGCVSTPGGGLSTPGGGVSTPGGGGALLGEVSTPECECPGCEHS